MDEPFYSYFIRSGWKGRVESPAALGAKFVMTLDALSRIDPMFANWELAAAFDSPTVPLDEARSNIAGLIEDCVSRDDFHEPDPYFGYHPKALAGDSRDARSVIFGLNAGGEHDGSTKLTFGFFSNVPPDLTIVTYSLCKAALLAINAIWRAPWACAQAFDSAPVMIPVNIGGVQGTRLESVAPLPRDPTFPYSIFHVPWIAYLAKEFAAGVKLPPEILTERTRDGGLLMTATKERFDPDNPEHARRARILAETMIKQTGHPSGRRRPIRDA
jgi:Immunity protein 52